MTRAPSIAQDLASISDVQVTRDVPLSEYTRFGIGGPASVFVETANEASFQEVFERVKASNIPAVIIGNGTNLIVADRGFPGVVLRFTNATLRAEDTRVYAAAGVLLQNTVDFSISRALAGIHTMTGIPGCVGAAVYGNAGAYGRSISQSVRRVRFTDGTSVIAFDNSQCEFHYRESVFKRNKHWIVFSVELQLEPADGQSLHQKATEILSIRNRKYPPEMKCAGSIFKNLLLSELPAHVREQVPDRVIIEGKVPSAYFLEAIGAKGMKDGDIHVADYHANLIYNVGHGTAQQVRGVIHELKRRVGDRFGFVLEEEVQYVGFDDLDE